MPDKQYPPYSGPKKPYVPVDLNFAGVQGNDRFSIHTPQGAKWMTIGQEANGYLISGYNPDSRELQVSKGGRHFIVPMNSGAPQEYTPPSASMDSPYTTDPTQMVDFTNATNKGTMSPSDQELINSFVKRGIPAEEAKAYNIPAKEFMKIFNNAQQSASMSQEQKNNIYSLNAYYQNLEAGRLKPNENYYIPRRDSNGIIDFDVFTYKPEGK
jgi:hypothetical protein